MNLIIEGNLLSTYYWILLLGFAVSVAFGYVSQRKNFCIMGALSDWRNLNETTRLMQWLVAVGVAMMGFALLSVSHLIPARQAFYLSANWLWLSSILGGVVFGFGMVLASGCPNKSLLRMGGGNLKALLVLIVLGYFARMTMQGELAPIRADYLDVNRLSLSPHIGLGAVVSHYLTADWVDILQVSLGLFIGLGLIIGVKLKFNQDFWHLASPGIYIGLMIVVVWFISGNLAYVEEHAVTLESYFIASRSGKMENISHVAPLANLVDFFDLYSKKQTVFNMGMVSVFGILAGSFLAHRKDKTFRWEGFTKLDDFFRHLLGAMMMGFGGVLALGCTTGQGLAGLSTLSINSFSSVMGIVAGAWLAFRYLEWRIMRTQ